MAKFSVLSTTAIVILNWNGQHYLDRFLPSVIRRSYYTGVSVVVADNGSTDGSVEWLKEKYPKVRIVELDQNYGFTGGYNRALKEIEADYYILLNSDIEVTEGWVEPLIKGMDSHPEIGICMPKIRSHFEKELFEYAGACGGFIDLLGYPFCGGRILSNIEKDNNQYDFDREIFWASGAALMIRASLYQSLGGLDVRFFAHMEEIDMCWRAKLLGHKVWIFTDSVVYHVGGGTLPNDSPRKLYFNYRNNLLMLYKNLPISTLWIILPVRLIADGISALVYLLWGKVRLFNSVLKAHLHFWRMLPKTVRSERKIAGGVSCIFTNSIVLVFFLSAKRLRFIDIEEYISRPKL